MAGKAAAAAPAAAAKGAEGPSPPAAVQGQKKRGGWTVGSVCNTTTVACLLVVAYVGWCSLGIHRVMYPLQYLPPLEPGAPTLDPLWPEGRGFDVLCYLSDSAKDARVQEQAPVWRAEGLTFGWGAEEEETMKKKGKAAGERWWSSTTGGDRLREIRLRLLAPDHTDASSSSYSSDGSSDQQSCSSTGNTDAADAIDIPVASPAFWQRVRRGKDVYLHVFVVKRGGLVTTTPRRAGAGAEGAEGGEEGQEEVVVSLEGHDGLKPLHGVVPLVKRQPYEVKPPKRRLLSGAPAVEPVVLRDGDQGLYWKPEVAVRLVTDASRYPLEYLPPQIVDHLQVIDLGRRQYRYLPPIHVDEIGLTSDKYIGLNGTLAALPLTLSYSPMSLQRWQLMNVLEASLSRQKALGLEDSDIDDVRRLVTDTNVYLLAITILASVLHLLFEFLAFQSDIAFWRKNKSLRGLSVRSVVVEFFCQMVILAYLIDAGSSLLVTVPSAFGLLIQLWKVQRATGATVVRGRYGLPSLVFTRLQQQQQDANAAASNTTTSSTDKGKEGGRDEQATMDLDRVAINHLSLVLLPLALGLAARSLLTDEFTGWYSWALSTLTSAVYTFGFILMTPQLYINYRLKSVSHLPWRFLCFRFVNTFIDDLFAFIIKMPTMHRLSCFRDDVVFLVYLYQRWIYPVDASRKMDAEDCGGN